MREFDRLAQRLAQPSRNSQSVDHWRYGVRLSSADLQADSVRARSRSTGDDAKVEGTLYVDLRTDGGPAWLCRISGSSGYCGDSRQGSPLNYRPRRAFYTSDVGGVGGVVMIMAR